MRLTHVTDCYLPRLGGIELQVRDLAARQRAAGHDVDVVTSTPAAIPTATAIEELPVRRPQLDERRAVGHIAYTHSRRGARAAVDGRPDVLHVHLSLFSPLGIAAVSAAVAARVPVVVTMHSLWNSLDMLFGASRSLLPWHRWPIVWTAVSGAAAAPIARRSRSRVFIVPNGVDRHWWSAAAAASPAPDVRLLTVGRLTERKQPMLLLNAVAQLSDRVGRDRMSLSFVGDGDLRAPMARRIEADGLTNVRLLGAQEPAAIRRLMSEHDVFVAPARLESFGIAALEARFAGMPLVAHRRSGVAEYVAEGFDALLFDDGRLAATLSELLEQRRLAGLGSAARASCPRLGWDHTLAGYELAYAAARRAVGRHSQPAARVGTARR